MADHLKFYFAPQSRALIVMFMLEELGQPFELEVINFKAGDTKKPEFLKVNPMGKVPAIVHNGVAVTEAAAICTYLADAFPQAGLNVPVGDSQRGPYLRWLFFGPSCLEVAIVDKLFQRADGPEASMGYGTLERSLEMIERGLEPGPWLMGDRFTAADVVIGSTLMWGKMVKVLPDRPALDDYVARVMQRPAWQRVQQRDREVAGSLA